MVRLIAVAAALPVVTLDVIPVPLATVATKFPVETADVASNYASVLYFDLPKTGITVTYPKSYFLRPNGRDDVSGVIPEVLLKRAPIGVADDVVLDEAIRYIREQAARAGSHTNDRAGH